MGRWVVMTQNANGRGYLGLTLQSVAATTTLGRRSSRRFAQHLCDTPGKLSGTKAEHALQAEQHGQAWLAMAVFQQRHEHGVDIGAFRQHLLGQLGGAARFAQFDPELSGDCFGGALGWHLPSKRGSSHPLHKL